MIEKMIEVVIAVIGAYLIGSIPTGYIIVKLFTGQDIRTIGSGSTGATNVKRVMGKKWFFIVMFLDAFKGALPVILAKIFATAFVSIGLIPVLCAISAILGHSKSIFLKFTGGKSVASGVGTILALNWMVGLMVAITWAIVTYISKYVSLGSIIALSVSPILMYLCKEPAAYIAYCVLGAIYIVYLHRTNIVRLLKGEESKVR
jgi:glycerol-3-phosphate acyltransferase PlsY